MVVEFSMIRTAFVQDLINNMFLMVVKHSMIRTDDRYHVGFYMFLRVMRFSICRTNKHKQKTKQKEKRMCLEDLKK